MCTVGGSVLGTPMRDTQSGMQHRMQYLGDTVRKHSTLGWLGSIFVLLFAGPHGTAYSTAFSVLYAVLYWGQYWVPYAVLNWGQFVVPYAVLYW